MKRRTTGFPMRMILIAMVLLLVTASLSACGSEEEDEDVSVKAASVSTLTRRDLMDLHYGDEDHQTLDLYLPTEGEGPWPLIVFIHGGGWISGDKQDGQQNTWVTLRDQGYAVASLNYRLIGEASYPEPVEDCIRAVSFLIRHAGLYHLDISRYALTGESAGAQYALMTALDETIEKPDALVLWYPVTDLNRMFDGALEENELDETLFTAFLSAALPVTGNETADYLRDQSPLTHASEYSMPILLEHGTQDTMVPYEHSADFVQAVEEAGGEITFITVEGAGHSGEAFSSEENLELILDFLDEHVKDAGD